MMEDAAMSGSAYAPESPWPSYYGGRAQMDPQGIFGKVLGAIAGPVGGIVAGPAGGVVGGILGRQLGRVIPFGMTTRAAVRAAGRGRRHDRAVGPPLAQHLGGMLGYGQLGQQVGNVLGTVGRCCPSRRRRSRRRATCSPKWTRWGSASGG
jgi:hypothetical protein